MPSKLPHLELVCFGPPTARVAGKDAPAVVVRPKHLALLIYLALSPDHTRTRDHLLGLLWTESPEPQARHALNQSLLRLRQTLGAQRLRSSRDAVQLHDAGLTVDARRFETLAGPDPGAAVALLRGDFLEGFAVDGAPEFEDWSARERERYRARAAATLLTSGEEHVAAGHLIEAGDLARRALALEPYSEPAVRLAMRAAALAGERAAALAAFHAFAKRLDSDLHEGPSRQLAALRERIDRHTWRPPRSAAADSEPPLVGRHETHRRAFELLRLGLTDGARTLVITGAPGMGRSRLLKECVERLMLEGAVSAVARPLHTDHDAPWSTLRLVLRGGLGAAPGAAGVDPAALALLASVAPELAAHHAPSEPRDVAEMGAALASLIAAVAAEQPVVVALDDAHHADRSTLSAMLAAIERLTDVPAVFLITTLEGESGALPELLRWRSEVGRKLRGAGLRLPPLVDSDVRSLVETLAPWCAGDDERDRLTRRLVAETGGSPLFVVTLLAGLQRLTQLRGDWVAWPPPQSTLDSPWPVSIPDITRASIAARIVDLEDGARDILTAASVCGVAIEPELVAAMTKVPRDQVERQLATLERRHFVTFNGGRYAFVAPIVMDAVRSECLTRGELQRSRKRAATALAGRTNLESRVLRAELLAAAEPGAAAFAEALEAGRAAVAEGALRTARRALAATERVVAKVDDPTTRAALEELRAAVAAATTKDSA